MEETLPWRAAGPDRPPAPVDPRRLPRFRGLRPLKRWRYVGAYGDDVLLCAGEAHIGGAPQTFWAVWDRRGGRLRERTRYTTGAAAFGDGAVRFAHAGVEAELAWEAAGEVVEVVSRHGAHAIWTAKTPLQVHGRVRLDGREIAVDVRGLLDESAGHHARVTRWSWSAGCGVAADGAAVTWNLVDGVHDAPVASERTVWVDGVAREVGPVEFAADLSAVRRGEDVLAFTAEAERARHDRFLVIDSAYRQPFGAFAGTLPGGVPITRGTGVMERHDVRW